MTPKGIILKVGKTKQEIVWIQTKLQWGKSFKEWLFGF